MPEPIEEQLGFDISSALQGIASIDDALQQVTQSFQVGLAQALETLTSVGADVAPLADTLDVAGLGPAIDTAITDAASQPQTVALDGDPAGISSAIDDATAVSPIVDVGADTTLAQGHIDELTATPIEIPVTADTTEAQQQISDLGQSATDASAGVDSLSGGVEILKAGTGLASGEVESLGGVISNISPAAAEAVGGMAALAASIGAIVTLAADAQAQNARFAATFGTLADAVRNINVGGLRIDLKDLGAQSGTTNADLEATASRIGQLGKTSGAADGAIVSTTQKLLALGATVAVNNPRLGDAAAVTDRLGNALARGGRSLGVFGIGLTSAQITTEALKESGKSAASELTQFDKITAGATLAVRQFGGTLGKEFVNGSQNAQVQFRALKVSVEEALSAIGQPLVAPVLQVLTDLTPIATSAGGAIGGLAQVAIPLVQSLVTTLGPVAPLLDAFATGLGTVGDTLQTIPAPLRVLGIELGILAIAGRAAATSFVASGLIFASSPFGAAVLGITGAITALGLFSDHTKQATADTTTLANAFGRVSDSSTTFTGTLTGLNKAIDDYLKAQLQAGDVGNRVVETTNRIGLTNDDLRRGLLLSGAAFDAWEVKITNAALAAGASDKQSNALFDTLEQGRTALQGSAAGALEAAVNNKILTQSEVDLIAARHTRKFTTDAGTTSETDFIAVLAQEAAKIDAGTAALQAHAAVTFQGADSQKAFAESVRLGTVTLKDAKAVADQYGLSLDQATQAIQNTEAAQDRAAAATVQRTAAYRDLVDQIALGRIGELDAQFQLRAMGFTADGAAAAYKSLGSTIASSLQTADSSIHTAKDAAQKWQQDITAAFTKVADDVKNHTGNIKADLASLAADQDPKKFADNLIQQSADVAAFQANLKKLVAEGFGDLAGFITTLNPDIAAPLARAVASDRSKAEMDAAAFELFGASKAGFDRWKAQNAAALGFDLGAQIAPGITAGAAPVGDAAEAIAGQVTERFHPNFDRGIHSTTTAAAAALAADPTIGQAAGEAGLRAVASFADAFGPLSAGAAARVALQGAHDAIQRDPTLAVASGKKGDETSGAFKPKIDAATKKAFDQAAVIIPQLTNIATAAGTAGHAVGVAFDTGMVQGITERTGEVITAAASVAAQAEAAAKKKLGITSPSKVGIEIGHLFVQGIAIGLGDTTGIASAGANLAVTVSNSAALTSLGASVTSSVVAGFNDPATVEAAVKTLQALVAKAAKNAAQTAATTAASSFASGIISGLPDAGTAISTFSQNVSQAAATQTAAFNAVHAAYQKYAEDLRKKAPTATLGADLQTIATTAKDLGVAQHALAVASNPAQFVKNLRAQTAANEQFQANLRKLIRLGDTDLANQLAQAGPTAAGKLAASLASKPALARTAEAAIDHAAQFSKSYQAFLEKQFAPEVHTLAAQIGQQTGAALNAGISVNGVVSPIAAIGQHVVAAGTPNTPVTQPSVAASQTLNLELAIELPDGTILNAKQTVKVPATAAELARIKMRTKAAVIA